MVLFYNGKAITTHGSNNHTGHLVFTDSYCEFSSKKYCFQEHFYDITSLSANTVNIAIPSIFGIRNRQGISVCYDSSCIGEFVLEEGNASDVLIHVQSFVHSEIARLKQEEQNRLTDEAKKHREIEDGHSEYERYINQQEAREKERIERLDKKKADAKGNSDKELDEAFMYIALLMESAAGNPNENGDKFARVYSSDFPDYDELQIKQLRAIVIEEMKDKIKCKRYLDLFNAQSLADRFQYSAGNLFTISHKGMDSLDLDQIAVTALKRTSDYFTPEEMSEVIRMMNDKKGRIRKQIDDQFIAIQHEWIDYGTANSYLFVEVSTYDGKNYQPISEFQKLIEKYVVSVKISTMEISAKVVAPLSAQVGNLFCWYWEANVKDIWEKAVGNGIKSAPQLDAIKFDVVNTAFEQVCEKWAYEVPVKKPLDNEMGNEVHAIKQYSEIKQQGEDNNLQDAVTHKEEKDNFTMHQSAQSSSLHRVKTFHTKLAGVTHSNTGSNTENRQRIIRQLSRDGQLEIGQELRLLQEPTNPYDNHAVAVLGPDGRQLGYLNKDIARAVFDEMSRGIVYKAFVSQVTGGSVDMVYGINIKIESYS